MDIHQLKLNMTSTVPPPLKLPSCSTYKATKLTELGTCTERAHVTGLFNAKVKQLCVVYWWKWPGFFSIHVEILSGVFRCWFRKPMHFFLG